MPYIRPVELGDDRALSHICLVTGAAGKSAAPYHKLPELVGLIFALPYNNRFKDLTFGFVLVEESGEEEEVVGYILGTTDSVSLRDVEEREWWPPLRTKYPVTVGGAVYPERTESDNRLIGVLHSPYVNPSEVTDVYPAHIHIDILPSHQRKGFGRKLMRSAVEYLQSRGHTGLFVGLDPANDEAKKFYARLGFRRIEIKGELWALDFDQFIL